MAGMLKPEVREVFSVLASLFYEGQSIYKDHYGYA